MINTSDLRKGITIELDGTLYSVIEYQHIKMGRGSAQVRLKLRDIRGGHTIEKTFQAGEKFSRARLDRHPMQFLYEDSGLYYFMNTETYDQTPLTKEQVGDALLYLKENETCDLLTYGDDPIEIELPTTVELRVTQTDPGFKGDTTSGATKSATLETGLTVQVPLFIDEGNVLKVDTRSGQYVERVST
ncbi:MAG TPA: elongation factor P [Dehalococcoidia bacterium]|nr:elongation factor P [Dehalococcoidia bacterium]